MGIELVSEAMMYAVDVPLTFNEYRLLIGMARTALDTTRESGGSRPRRRYFDTREAMCLAIGRRVADAATANKHEQAERSAAMESVRVALNGLIRLGAVRQEKSGAPGQRAEFSLLLDVADTRATREFRARIKRAQAKRVASSERLRKHRAQDGPGVLPGDGSGPTPQDGSGPTPQDGSGPTPQDGSGPTPQDGSGPKEQRRNNEGLTTGITSPDSTTSLGPVDKSMKLEEVAA